MSDLDSFFAKKDKKKNKGKKFTTTDEIAKRLENTEKKVEKTTQASVLTKKEDVPDVHNIGEVTEKPLPDVDVTAAVPEAEPVIGLGLIQKVEEEQWNDFKDDETVDVSNLKITKLNIDDEDEGRAGGGEGGDESKDSSGEDKKDGVWKLEEQRSIQSTILEAVDAGLDDNLQEVKAAVAAMNAKDRWNSQLSREMQPSPLPRGSGGPGLRRKKTAPDINNAMAFPSLADAKATGNRKKNQDERDGADHYRPYSAGERSHGGGGGLRLLSAREGSGGNNQAYRPPMLRTNNRFGALTDHSSLMRNS